MEWTLCTFSGAPTSRRGGAISASPRRQAVGTGRPDRRRLATNKRLADAAYHQATAAVQRDDIGRANCRPPAGVASLCAVEGVTRSWARDGAAVAESNPMHVADGRAGPAPAEVDARLKWKPEDDSLDIAPLNLNLIKRKIQLLAESVIGRFKIEVVKRFSPCTTVGQIEWETLGQMHWYDKERLQGAICCRLLNEKKERSI